MLAYQLFTTSTSPPRFTTVFLHGMLGRSLNLRGFAKQFLDDDNAVLMVDLRGHGNSPKNWSPPHTVDACAEDVKRLLTHLHNKGEIANPIPRRVIGHSFGGKTALCLCDKLRPSITWVLDSVPGPLPNMSQEGGDSVIRLIQELQRMGKQVPSRSELIDKLTAAHFSHGVATWMTTNVVDIKGNQHEWAFDLDIAKALIEDYRVIDLWPIVKRASPQCQIRFIRAAQNHSMWHADIITSFNELHNPNVKLLTMPDVGHFLHAEKPKELFDMIRGVDG